MFGLMKDLAGMLNQSSLNALTFPLTDRYQEVVCYIDLPVELGSPRKGLINIKNKNQQCFLWCRVRHINPSKKHPEKILKMLKKLIMMKLSSPCKKKILARLR